MKRTQLINIICSLILASLLMLGVVITVVLSSANDGPLIIESQSEQKEYDSYALTSKVYTVLSGRLRNGHMIQAEFLGSQTEIGTSENIFTVKRVDALGKDVTHKYEIELVYGKLNVTPIELTIETPWADKIYDGTPLECKEWSVVGNLMHGHELTLSVTGSQTEIGSSPNSVENVAVLDVNGYDVSKYYNINILPGELVVRDPNDPGGQGGGGVGGGSGSVGGGSSVDLSGNIASGEGNGTNELCLRLKNEISDIVYLKIKSFGAYTGKSWKNAEKYDKLINGNLSASYLASIAIGQVDSKLEIESLSDQYFLPYYMSPDSGEYDIQTSDVLYTGNTENVYSVYYGKFDYSYIKTLPSNDSYTDYEYNYRSFVNSQYLEIDDTTLEYMKKIIKEQGFHKNDLKTILKVAKYIQKSATYSLNYDRALDEEENIVIAFLDKYKKGICQHYASAATLLYRAMGIPARYTVGFVASTEAGEWVDVKGNSAHAWVEVYIKNMGWVQIEVTNGFEGSGENSEEPIYSATISPVRVEKLYDGTPLYAENKIDGFEKYEEQGYTYEAVISGSRTELGKSFSIIESFIVYDRYGNDVTDKFVLNFEVGSLHVYKAELVFESAGEIKEYDGLPLVTDLSACRMVGGNLERGESYEISDPFSIVDAMTVAANFRVVIKDVSGNDITDTYKITKNCGTLKITPRKITVKAADATKKFDGRVLEDSSYSIIEGSLSETDFIVMCLVEGSQIEIGRSDNIVKDISIYNKDAEDVTYNYLIKLETGTLRVTP